MRIKWLWVMAAFFVTNAALPLCIGMMLLSPDVEWAGIVYRKKKGRIELVDRRNGGVRSRIK